MRKRIWLAPLFALALLMLFVSCKGGTQNEVATSRYGLDADTHDIVRYDYNTDGMPLGSVLLDPVTLTEKRLLSVDRDHAYTYDRKGALIGHKHDGAALTMTFDEQGFPVSGVGYDVIGERVQVTYELDKSGRITRETVASGEKARGGLVVDTYTYDAQSRVVSWHCQYPVRSGLEDELREKTCDIVYADDAVTADSYTLKLDAQGRPTELWRDDKNEPIRTWTWDESGRLVASMGEGETNELSYGASGALDTVVSRDNESGQTSERHYSYGRSGELLSCTERYQVKDDARTENTTSYEDGRRARVEYFYYQLDADGNETVTQHTVVQLTKEASLQKTYQVDEQGNETLNTVYELSFDSLGRKTRETTSHYAEEGWMSAQYWSAWGYAEDGTMSSMTYDGEAWYREDGACELKGDKTKYYDADGVWYLEVYTYEGLEEDGAVMTSRSESDIDEKGRTLRTRFKGYRDGELIEEYVRAYDYAPDSDVYMTYHGTSYEKGEIVSAHSRTEFMNSESVSTDKQYEDGVLRLETQQYCVQAWWHQEEYSTFSRPVNETVKHYDETGALTHTETVVYTYHASDYLASKTFDVTDAQGKMNRSYTEEYDEAGVLIRTVERE